MTCGDLQGHSQRSNIISGINMQGQIERCWKRGGGAWTRKLVLTGMKRPLKCFKMAKKHSYLALSVKKLYFYLNVLSKLNNDKLYLFYME